MFVYCFEETSLYVNGSQKRTAQLVTDATVPREQLRSVLSWLSFKVTQGKIKRCFM